MGSYNQSSSSFLIEVLLHSLVAKCNFQKLHYPNSLSLHLFFLQCLHANSIFAEHESTEQDKEAQIFFIAVDAGWV